MKILICCLLALLVVPFAARAEEAQKSAFDRVVQRSELRCSYTSYDPMVIIDPNTKKMSGIFYDLINEIGKRAGLKVSWVEEVGFGNINAGFVTGRYDAFCAGLWPSANRAKSTVFSAPLFYDPISVFGRADDTRFDKDWKILNDAAYKVAITEGDATQGMAAAVLPKAIPFFLSENQTIADEINNVTSKKADATFRDLISAKNYLKSNPGTLKNLSPKEPVFMYPLTIGINKGEYSLKTLIDTVIVEMQDDGTVERTVKKYMGPDAGLFYHSKHDYRPFE